MTDPVEAVARAIYAASAAQLDEAPPWAATNIATQGAYMEMAQAALAAERPIILAEAAGIAERDVNWCRFGQNELEPWEAGRDDARDYRLGIVAGRAIAQAIRTAGAKPDA